MKPILEGIKTVFVYAIRHETQTNFISGREVKIKIPTKEVHLFEIIETANIIQVAAISFCGIDRSKIGETIEEKEKRPSSLPVCPKCERAWKEDKRSPWHKWQEGKKI